MSRIISRSQWGARHQDGYGTRPVGRLEKYLHHTVTSTLSENASLSEDVAQIRVVERIGQQRFSVGMSYTFLITPSGRIFQGVSTHRISAHSGAGRNTRGAGVCLVGNFDTNRPTDKQISAVVWLLQEGVRRKWWGDPALTSMHRSFRGTACPGKHAAAQFEAINRRGRGESVSAAPPASAPAAPKPKPTPSKPAPAPTRPTNFIAGSKRVPVHSGASRERARIGTVSAGSPIRRDPGRDTRGWYAVGDRWFVHKGDADFVQHDGSKGLAVGEWPGRKIPAADSHTWESHHAWVELLARIGYTDSSLTVAMQKWLRKAGEDVGPADGDLGPRSVRALQRFLRTRNFYRGTIDGSRGRLTIRAEIAYLNSQLEHLGSKWPQHARA